MANRFPLIFNSGAGQIQELAASDNLDLTSSNLVNAGILFTSSGSVTAPSLQIGSGTTYNPGLYSPGADQVAVATNGVERVEFGTAEVVFNDGGTDYDFRVEGDTNANLLFVDASTDRVGIGTSSPGAALHVTSSNPGGYGTVLYNTSSTGEGLTIRAGSTSSHNILITQNYDGSATRLSVSSVGTTTLNAAAATAPFIANIGASEAARLDSSGRLLIGTSSTSTNLRALIQATSSNSAGSGNLYLARGESTPADGAGLGYLGFSDSNHTSAAGLEAVRDGGTWTSGSSQPSRLVFSTTPDNGSSPTERMRISNNGEASFFSGGIGGLTLRNSNATSTTNRLISGRVGATDNTYGSGMEFLVYTNGNVQNTNNSYGVISDIKLKENIIDASSQWNDIKALQVRNYNLKEGQTHKQIGLVAQEVELVSPGLVYESPDRDEDGNDLGTVTKGVHSSVLYMKAVKALQEAMERIEQLETSNTDLLARVIALETA